jgi:hypothetical protein
MEPGLGAVPGQRGQRSLSVGIGEPRLQHVDMANVALAHPFYPRDLAGLPGALRDSEIACSQQSDRVVARASHPLLAQGCAVAMSSGDQGHRTVELSFGTLREGQAVDGLRVRMMASAVKTAFRLGLEQLQLAGPPEEDRYGARASLHGTRTLLGMGWDVARRSTGCRRGCGICAPCGRCSAIPTGRRGGRRPRARPFSLSTCWRRRCPWRSWTG